MTVSTNTFGFDKFVFLVKNSSYGHQICPSLKSTFLSTFLTVIPQPRQQSVEKGYLRNTKWMWGAVTYTPDDIACDYTAALATRAASLQEPIQSPSQQPSTKLYRNSHQDHQKEPNRPILLRQFPRSPKKKAKPASSSKAMPDLPVQSDKKCEEKLLA